MQEGINDHGKVHQDAVRCLPGHLCRIHPDASDGGALLTLRNGEEIVTRRVVSAAQLADEKRMYWFINAVRRDLALEAGSLPVDVVGTLRRLQERGLPSYMAG